MDETGLYYFGARYYDPEIGRFITRDRKQGRINNPKTLNRYVYCANNPMKYIDPDGRDYFEPEWAHHGSEKNPDFSWEYAWISSQLLAFEIIGKMLTDYYNWASENPYLNSLLSVGAAGVVGLLAVGAGIGGPWGVLIGVIVGLVFIGLNYAAEHCAELWNDPVFSDLFNTAQMYAQQMAFYSDCEQEFLDAWCELAVYLLQVQYGDDWRNHAPPELLDYYDKMMERKGQSSDSDSEEDELDDPSSESPSFNPNRIPI